MDISASLVGDGVSHNVMKLLNFLKKLILMKKTWQVFKDIWLEMLLKKIELI